MLLTRGGGGECFYHVRHVSGTASDSLLVNRLIKANSHGHYYYGHVVLFPSYCHYINIFVTIIVNIIIVYVHINSTSLYF